jgi:hypothetical protein
MARWERNNSSASGQRPAASGPGSPLSTSQDSFLESNPMFQEMLLGLEDFDASLANGESPSKYDSEFFAALRTLLRECLFSKNTSARQSEIARVYTWYQEKRTRSEFAKTSGAAAPLTPKPPERRRASTAPAPPHDKQDRRVRYLSRQLENSPRRDELALAGHSLGGAPPPHDLTLSDLPHPSLTPGDFFHSGEAPAPTPFDGSSTRPATAMTAVERLAKYRMRDLRLSRFKRENPLAAVPTQTTVTSTSLAANPREEAMQRDKALEEVWLKRREQQEAEKGEDAAVEDALRWWAVQRARREEEALRRQESVRYTSQTDSIYRWGGEGVGGCLNTQAGPARRGQGGSRSTARRRRRRLGGRLWLWRSTLKNIYRRS